MRTKFWYMRIESARPVVGTLAHNRSFTASEITEYTRFDRRIDGPWLVKNLLATGLIKKTEERGRYYPTAEGWDWIEGKKTA